MKRAIWALVIIAGVAAVAGVALYGAAVPVEITRPAAMTVREYIIEDGKTRLGTEYIVDMPVNGTVERIELEVGDVVAKGRPIARIDPYPLKQRVRELEALIEQARARIAGVDVQKPKEEDIESARVRVNEAKDSVEIARKVRASLEVNFEDAKREHERSKALVEQGIVSRSQYDQARARFQALEVDVNRAKLEEDAALKNLRVAELTYQRISQSIGDNEYLRDEYKAEIDRLQAQLALLKSDLDKTVVLAPVAGPVLEKYVEDRRVLAAGAPLLRIGDMDTIEIECDVLSEEIARVRAGCPVEISGKALGGKTIPGEVRRIHPSGFMKISSLGVEQQRVKTIIAFDNAGAGLRPGTSVDVSIITAESKDALAIPERAAFRRQGQWHVFVVEDGRARLRPITVGLRNDDWAEVLDGLTPETTIVAHPKNELEDGVRVAVSK
jgi:HlyD family secretion protein